MMTTKRKAYVRPMPSTRVEKTAVYRFYMLREGTAIPAVWFSLELCTVYALKSTARKLRPVCGLPCKTQSS